MTKELVICDICGKEIVKPDYDPRIMKYPTHKYILKLTEVSIINQEYTKRSFDLCPMCYEKLMSYIAGEKELLGGRFNVLQ